MRFDQVALPIPVGQYLAGWDEVGTVEVEGVVVLFNLFLRLVRANKLCNLVPVPVTVSV